MELIRLLKTAVALLLLHVFYTLCAAWHYSRKARKLGCLGLPVLSCVDPIGVTDLLQSLAADKEKLLPVLFDRKFRTMSEMRQRYVSTFMVRNPWQNSVITADPKNIQALLATQFSNFELGSVRRNSLCPLLGNGIFTADGEQWVRSRTLLRPQFTRDQINQLDLEEKHVHHAMNAIYITPTGWTTSTDIQSIFFRLTLDSATEFLFGESADSQLSYVEGRQSPEVSFARSFDDSQAVCAQRLRLGWLATVINFKKAQQSDRKVHTFVDNFVQRVLQYQPEEPNIRHTDKSRYVFLNALAAETRDPVELRSQSLNILLAGRDTTASLLSWTILLLARHPAVFSKLRDEIIQGFGTYGSPREINFSSLKSCQFLQFCLKESLRLFPVVPFNRRSAVVDTTLPHGGGPDGQSPIFIKKGQVVIYSTHILHRRKDFWGSDADYFKPERWHGRKVGWEYVPFNGGPRICIGQQFALTEASYVLVRLLQRFDQIEDVYPEREIRYSVNLTSCPADPVTVRMHQVQDE